jgi:hypothetical protein
MTGKNTMENSKKANGMQKYRLAVSNKKNPCSNRVSLIPFPDGQSAVANNKCCGHSTDGYKHSRSRFLVCTDSKKWNLINSFVNRKGLLLDMFVRG